MRKTRTIFAVAVLLAVAATSAAQAEPRTQSGKPAACKAPSGEYFGLGESIDLPVTDSKGNIVKSTYLCTENGWVKVARALPLGGSLIHIAPQSLKSAQWTRRHNFTPPDADGFSLSAGAHRLRLN